MQSKKYKFLDTEFETQKNVLAISRAWNPLQMYFDTVLKMYTENVDMSAINSYNDRLRGFQEMIDKDTRDLAALLDEPEPNKQLIQQVNDAIDKSKLEVEKIETEMSKDENVIKQQKEWLSQVNNASKQLLCSEMIPSFLNEYLIGDTSKLDYEKWEIQDFISEVIGDLFTAMSEKKKKINDLYERYKYSFKEEGAKIPKSKQDNPIDRIEFMIDELAEAHGLSKTVIANEYDEYDYHIYKLRKSLISEREQDYINKNKPKE